MLLAAADESAAGRWAAGVVGDLVEPAAEGTGADFFGQGMGEEDEDGLGDIFGEMRVAQYALCGRVDGGKMAIDELAEGGG